MAATDEHDRLAATLPALPELFQSLGVRVDGPVKIEKLFNTGQSNPTFLLRAGSRAIVLRKQPIGALAPKAHNVIREFMIMRALSRIGFPVPKCLGACNTPNPIGTDFFLMDFVPGNVFVQPMLPDCSGSERSRIYCILADTLSRLHSLNPNAIAEAGIMPRQDFVGRQVDVWWKQYLATRTEEDARIDAVGAWLIANKPKPSTLSIVHGDFRIGNLIFGDGGEATLLDWELCTIGTPEADLAYCCLWYHLPQEILGGLTGLDLVQLGIPDESQFIDRYKRQRGTAAAVDLSYFMVLAFYRLAAILQGVYKRALQGNAVSPKALARGQYAKFCLDKAASLAG